MSLIISNMSRRFGSVDVLRGVDLGVKTGELIALLGPSGSGKTTLLRIIAGLDWPDAGTLTVAGQDWLSLRAQDRRTGFVFQHYALFPHMRVRDNIAFGLNVLPRTARPGRAAIDAKVEELLNFLQIAPLAERFPSELSGGQRQRVALGRALAIGPQVLLLDEPFGALDAQVRRDLRRWLRDVHDATGTTTIFVTHDQEEAFELADRVVVMGEGRIEQTGSPDEIYDHPATRFVARFLGLSVELPVTLRAGRAEAANLDTQALERRALPDGPGTLFLRPAEITLIPAASSRFRIATIASTGAQLRFTVTDDAGVTFETEAPRRGGAGLIPGTPVTLRPLAGQVFADTHTGSGHTAHTQPLARIAIHKESSL